MSFPPLRRIGEGGSEKEVLLPYPYEQTVSVPPVPGGPFPPLCLSHVQTRGALTGAWEHVCISLPVTCQRFCLGDWGDRGSVPQSGKGGLDPRE